MATIIPNLIDRILSLVPNAQVTVKNNDYDTVEWHPSNSEPLPTLAEVQAVDEFVKTRKQLKEKVNQIAKEKANLEDLEEYRQVLGVLKIAFILNKKINGAALTSEEQTFAGNVLGLLNKLQDIETNRKDLHNQIDAAADPHDVDLDSGWPT